MSGQKIKITEAKLKRAVDPGSWKRGQQYFRMERAGQLLEDAGEIFARVRGGRNYRVRLWVEDGEAEGECSCPMGDAGVFCKHCIAVGLTYIDHGADRIASSEVPCSKAAPERRKPGVSLDDVRTALTRRNKAELVEIIMGQARQDGQFRESLLMEVAQRQPGGPDVETFRRAIDSAMQMDDFVDYHSAYDFTHGVDNVIDSIVELHDAGHHEEVIELAEHAMECCVDALGSMDDSGGAMSEALERLGELHHSACVAAGPDPKALAQRLFAWEMQDEWGTFLDAAETYADVLGPGGLDVYRRLAQSQWEKIPPLKAGDERVFDGRRFRATSIMESLAKVSGDIDELVEIKSRDLSCPWHYLQIAKIYKEGRKPKKALEWAERGAKAFPDTPDARLESFLADEYHRLKRHDEAMTLVWGQFTRRSDLSAYKHLRLHARKARGWPAWRATALEHIEAEIGKAMRARPKDSWPRPPADHSLLVEVFLWEKSPEKAWKEARVGGCRRDLWIELAKAREADHPEDAIAIYQKEIDSLVGPTTNGRYSEPIALAKRVRKLMTGAGRGKDFTRYVSDVRAQFKRKRNFIALLAKL